jgi:acyl carrier protein
MSSQAISRDRVLEAIYAAIDVANAGLPADRQLAKDPDTVLFAAEGGLDSLGLVGLVVDVEQHLADAFGIVITLADEKAMSQRTSPFRSVAALADYASGVIAETTRG